MRFGWVGWATAAVGWGWEENLPQHGAREVLLLGRVEVARDQDREAITGVRDELCAIIIARLRLPFSPTLHLATWLPPGYHTWPPDYRLGCSTAHARCCSVCGSADRLRVQGRSNHWGTSRPGE